MHFVSTYDNFTSLHTLCISYLHTIILRLYIRFRRRKGYSAFKRCRPHRSDDIATLYRLANDDNCPEQQLYRDKLHRWGFNYERQCCLFTFDALLVRLPGRQEVFPCVDYRDRMHGLSMFLHRILFTALAALVKKRKHSIGDLLSFVRVNSLVKV